MQPWFADCLAISIRACYIPLVSPVILENGERTPLHAQRAENALVHDFIKWLLQDSLEDELDNSVSRRQNTRISSLA